MSEDRDAKLRERTQELVRAINAGECDGERILAALRQTEEEAHAESDAWYSQAMDHLNAMRGRAVKCEPDCWVCAAVFAARAEGERAGREAEREAWAAWCEAEAAGCRALDLPYCERALLSKAAEVRARGSE